MIFVSRGYYNVLIHIQLALIKSYAYQIRILITSLVSSNPYYAIQQKNHKLFVKTNFKNVILLNYVLRQHIKGKNMYTYKTIPFLKKIINNE